MPNPSRPCLSFLIWLASIAVGLGQAPGVGTNLPVPTNGVRTASNDRSSTFSPLQQQPASPARTMIDPNVLVLHAVQQAVWGPPIACKVYQQSTAFDQQVVTSGEYKAGGGGAGQFRYTARISSGETTLDMLQVSDGRLMYTQIGSNSPRLVNVEKVRESLGQKIHRPAEHPEISLQLSIGGQPELLRSLYCRYHWYRAVEGKVNGVDVWQLLGKLRTEPPKISANARLDRELIGLAPTTDQLPANVRLTLGRSASLPYFPYLVEYFRIKKDKDGKAVDVEPVSKLEYSEPTTQVTIVETDFVYRADSVVDKIESETELYLP